MKPALGSAWELKLEQGQAYLYRCLDHQVVGTLSGVEAFMLGLLDGSRSVEAVAKLLHSLAGEAGAKALYALVARLKPLLVEGHRRQLPYSLETLLESGSPHSTASLRPLPGPLILHWWVTNYCPRRCYYCFAKPKHGSRAVDAVLTRETLKRIFREAKSLGTTRLLMSGGEPLLRTDLPEVMGDALAQEITPLLTTKHPVTTALAQRLAQAGVQHLSLSLDTLDETENQFLVGSPHYAEQVRRSAQCLTTAGVAFSIQAVATRLNLASLSKVANFASEVGARLLHIVPFAPVLNPKGKSINHQLALPSSTPLADKIAPLIDRFPTLRVELFEQLGKGSRSGYRCDIGLTKLLFLPDGVVHRCYKLITDQKLKGVDLNQTSVAAAWHHPEFGNSISLSREAYTGSECGGCQRFNQCNQEGRCIYEALITQGRYAARDWPCGGPYGRGSPTLK